MILLKSAWHAFRWTALICSFGAFQLLIIWFFSLVLPDYPVQIEKILLDGVLMFFAVSMFISVFLEFFLDSDIRLPKTINLILIGIPAISIVIAALTYAILVFEYERIEKAVVLNIQNLLLILSVIYTMVLKTVIYFKRYNTPSFQAYGIR